MSAQRVLRRFLMWSSTCDLRVFGRFVDLESLLVEGVRFAPPLFGTADLRVRREDMVVGGGRGRRVAFDPV